MKLPVGLTKPYVAISCFERAPGRATYSLRSPSRYTSFTDTSIISYHRFATWCCLGCLSGTKHVMVCWRMMFWPSVLDSLIVWWVITTVVYVLVAILGVLKTPKCLPSWMRHLHKMLSTLGARAQMSVESNNIATIKTSLTILYINHKREGKALELARACAGSCG